MMKYYFALLKTIFILVSFRSDRFLIMEVWGSILKVKNKISFINKNKFNIKVDLPTCQSKILNYQEKIIRTWDTIIKLHMNSHSEEAEAVRWQLGLSTDHLCFNKHIFNI